jgi:hypothetical protein
MTARKHRRRLLHLGLLLLLAVSLVGNVFAQGETERRILVGLKLFPTFLAADEGIAAKRDADGRLQLLLLYSDDRATAEELARRLTAVDTVRGMPVEVEVAPYADLDAHQNRPVGGIFLTQWVDDGELAEVVRFGIENHVVVFSPFKGDVKRGVLAGLFVSDRILPYINMQTLRGTGLQMKPFFLEIAKRHG